MIQKVIDAQVKEVTGRGRTLEFIGSTEVKDRVGDIIEVNGWNLRDYKANPVFLWAHRYDQPPIGKATRVWRSNGQLKFNIEFADTETYEFADTIYKLYKGGFLNAVSVGFEPKEWEDMETKDDDNGWSRPRRYKKQDLLELSAVPVPANPEALQNAVIAGAITTKELDICNDEWCKAAPPGAWKYCVCGECSYYGDHEAGKPCGKCPECGAVMHGSNEEPEKAVNKPEETEDYIRIPVDECKVTATIDISESEGIKALYCGNDKKVATYLFDKDKGWTMEKAKKWVEDHKEGKTVITLFDIDAEAEILNEELGILKDTVASGGLGEECREAAINLAAEIYTHFVDAKMGAVLNAKNRNDLIEAKRRIDAVLENSQKPEEEPEEKPKANRPKDIFGVLGFNVLGRN